ncbi:MAG: methyltransferase [Pseudomonadota bacterium]
MPVLIAAWGVFLGVVMTLSLVAGRKKIRAYHGRGSLYMKLQYTLFFSVLTHALIFGAGPPENIAAMIGYGAIMAGLVFYLFSLAYVYRYYNPMVSVRENQPLCTRGPFRYIRHPMYTATMIMMTATALILQYPSFVILPLVFFFFFRTSRNEEEFLSEELSGYSLYRHSTKMYVPFVF